MYENWYLTVKVKALELKASWVSIYFAYKYSKLKYKVVENLL